MHIHHPETPFYHCVAGKIHPGMKIEVYGKVKHGCHQSFTVELVSGPTIVLHMNPRFGYGGCHELVMNSNIGGCWGHEERHHNPFHHGDHFDLKIKVHESHYDITVNGCHVCHFHHRMSPFTVDGLRIHGDVKIEDIHLHHHHC
uniref:Galectin n=1 Tax=Plectus sambesii TaxID=2011161 RepID=A0A914VZG4_9BILA